MERKQRNQSVVGLSRVQSSDVCNKSDAISLQLLGKLAEKVF